MTRIKHPADADLFLGSNGRILVNATALTLADRHGRRVIRVCELTPREEIELMRRFAELTGDLLVGVCSALPIKH